MALWGPTRNHWSVSRFLSFSHAEIAYFAALYTSIEADLHGIPSQGGCYLHWSLLLQTCAPVEEIHHTVYQIGFRLGC